MSDGKNVLLLVELVLQYAVKLREIGVLFRTAQIEGRDVTDEEVDSSSFARDAAIANTESTINSVVGGSNL